MNPRDYNVSPYYNTKCYELDDSNQISGLEDSPQMVQVSQTLMDGAYSSNEIKSIKFDPHEELIWCISVTGHLSGFYEWNLNKVVSVEVPGYTRPRGDEIYELLDILPSMIAADRVIYVLARNDLLIYKKTGGLQKKMKINKDSPLQCFCQHQYKESLLVLGTDNSLIELDVETDKQVSVVPLPNSGAQMLLKYRRGLLCGTKDGQIMTVDLRESQAIQHKFKPHGNTLSDFTVNHEGYAVISCGTFNKQYYSDQFLKVYDLRYRKPQCPIKVEMLQPSFVRFLPAFNDTVLVASASGPFQVASFGQNLLGRPTDEAMRMNEFDCIKAVDISSNSRLLAFGSRCGVLSLTASCPTADECGLKFNAASRETVFPVVPAYMALDPVPIDDPAFAMSSSEFAPEPLDSARTSVLSSDWPPNLCNSRYRKINPVDMSLFSQYQSKFKVELIGRKPAAWGSVWFPY